MGGSGKVMTRIGGSWQAAGSEAWAVDRRRFCQADEFLALAISEFGYRFVLGGRVPVPSRRGQDSLRAIPSRGGWLGGRSIQPAGEYHSNPGDDGMDR